MRTGYPRVSQLAVQDARVSEYVIDGIYRIMLQLNSCGRYGGGDGIYTHTVAYEADRDCLECSPAVVFEVRPDMTLQQV